jgi:hypothetical protein
LLIFTATRKVNVPPYCGVPRLSHHFPVAVVVTAVVTAEVDVVDVGIIAVDVVDVVVVGITFVVDVVSVVLDDLQDANTIDITMRHVSTIQINPFFI